MSMHEWGYSKSQCPIARKENVVVDPREKWKLNEREKVEVVYKVTKKTHLDAEGQEVILAVDERFGEAIRRRR